MTVALRITKSWSAIAVGIRLTTSWAPSKRSVTQTALDESATERGGRFAMAADHGAPLLHSHAGFNPPDASDVSIQSATVLLPVPAGVSSFLNGKSNVLKTI